MFKIICYFTHTACLIFKKIRYFTLIVCQCNTFCLSQSKDIHGNPKLILRFDALSNYQKTSKMIGIPRINVMVYESYF